MNWLAILSTKLGRTVIFGLIGLVVVGAAGLQIKILKSQVAKYKGEAKELRTANASLLDAKNRADKVVTQYHKKIKQITVQKSIVENQLREVKDAQSIDWLDTNIPTPIINILRSNAD